MRLSATKASSISSSRGLGNQLWDLGGARPSLDLNFAGNKSLTDSISTRNPITFTRASSGTYVGSDGVIKTAITNEARFDHNPTTGESLGLLVEEQRTNSVTNNTMVGAVVGTPGTLPTGWNFFAAPTGVTRTIVGTGTQNGINYIDIRFSGTPSSNGEITTYLMNLVSASANQAWTSSIWLAVVSGSTANMLAITLRNFELNPGYVRETGNNVLSSLTSTLTRFTNTTASFGSGATSIQFVLSVNGTGTGAIDITLRVGMPQLEQGAFATSVIPTTSATVTRSADVASITGANFSSWYNSTTSTIYSEAASSSGAAYSGYIYAIGQSFNDSIQHYRQADLQPVARVRTASVDEYGAIGNGAIWTGRSFNKFALALSASSGRQASNGTLNVEGDDTAIVLPTATTLSIGSLFNGFPANGTIRRLTYWPSRLPNATLQQITR